MEELNPESASGVHTRIWCICHILNLVVKVSIESQDSNIPMCWYQLTVRQSYRNFLQGASQQTHSSQTVTMSMMRNLRKRNQLRWNWRWMKKLTWTGKQVMSKRSGNLPTKWMRTFIFSLGAVTLNLGGLLWAKYMAILLAPFTNSCRFIGRWWS